MIVIVKTRKDGVGVGMERLGTSSGIYNLKILLSLRMFVCNGSNNINFREKGGREDQVGICRKRERIEAPPCELVVE